MKFSQMLTCLLTLNHTHMLNSENEFSEFNICMWSFGTFGTTLVKNAKYYCFLFNPHDIPTAVYGLWQKSSQNSTFVVGKCIV